MDFYLLITSTMHTVLIHGVTAIKHWPRKLAEARNKRFRLDRTNYSREFNRKVCNRDVLNRLLFSNDSFMICSRQRRRKKSKPYSNEILQLLLPKTSDGCPSDKNKEQNEEEGKFEGNVVDPSSEESD